MKQFENYMSPGRKGHLIGIGGVSMSSLAEVLHGMGIIISGSDVNDTNPNVLTLREKGIPVVNNPRRRGDQRFTVVVETPTRLTREQKELLRQLDGTLEESPKRKKFFDTIKDIFD